MAEANAGQIDYWNSDAARQWVLREALMDGLLAEVLVGVLYHAALQPGERVLDIGCGTGASCLAAAQAVGTAGQVTGLDIASALLARARERAADLPQVTFVEADAQTHAFAPASVDVMISRFGVMFFEDPVAAFANMARALRPGGRLVFAAWGPAAEVAWFGIPSGIAVARLGRPAPLDPTAPGPLAFQDPERVVAMMQAGGLPGARCLTQTVALTPPGDIAEAARFAVRLGPVARIMAERNGTEADALAIEAEVHAAFAGFATDGGLRLPATVHFYCAGGRAV